MSTIKNIVLIMCLLGLWNIAVRADNSLSSTNPSGWLDVTRFGAIPDDEENDADAIQKAIAFATKQNGGTVYLPHGVYLIDKPLTIHASGIILTGDGRSTVLKSNGCQDAIIRSLSCNRKRKGASPISRKRLNFDLLA